MSIKIKRIQSVESGDFKAAGGRTRANIEVPASVGFTDLQNSQLVLRMYTECTDNGGYGGSLPILLAWSENGEPHDIGGGQSLIRTSKVVSKEYGLLNEQRYQNVVNANLGWYLRSRSGAKAWNQTYSGGSGVHDYDALSDGGLYFSPFFDYSRPTEFGVQITAADNPSVNHDAEIRIPMHHIDRFADGIRQFPNVACGDLTYSIEFEDVISVTSPPSSNNTTTLQNITAVASEIGSDAAPLKQVPEKNQKYDATNINEVPVWCGMPVQVNYTDSGGDKNYITTISKLTLAATGELEIVLDTPAPTAGATDACTDVSLELYIDADITHQWVVKDVFLELHCLQLLPAQVEAAQKALNNLQINWFDYRLVKNTMGQTTDYSETLHVDPMCAGVAVFTPKNNELISCFDNATSYRWSIDGTFTTTRDVTVGPLINNTGIGRPRQLYNHMLQKWFGNLNKRLAKFDGYGETADDSTQENNHCMYPLVHPLLPRDSLLGFQLRASADMVQKGIYYLMVHLRSLTFKDGRLVR